MNVNWDDEIPNINGKIKNGNQTTNQWRIVDGDGDGELFWMLIYLDSVGERRVPNPKLVEFPNKPWFLGCVWYYGVEVLTMINHGHFTQFNMGYIKSPVTYEWLIAWWFEPLWKKN